MKFRTSFATLRKLELLIPTYKKGLLHKVQNVPYVRLSLNAKALCQFEVAGFWVIKDRDNYERDISIFILVHIL